MITERTSTYWMRSLRSNWLLIVILVGLVVFPFVVTAITGDGALGIQRGDRFLQRGQSVYWQSVFSEVFILCILAMSYNLLFGKRISHDTLATPCCSPMVAVAANVITAGIVHPTCC